MLKPRFRIVYTALYVPNSFADYMTGVLNVSVPSTSPRRNQCYATPVDGGTAAPSEEVVDGEAAMMGLTAVGYTHHRADGNRLADTSGSTGYYSGFIVKPTH